MKTKTIISRAFLAISLTISTAVFAGGGSFDDPLLLRLDDALDRSDKFVNARLERISAFRSVLAQSSLPPEQRYLVNESIFKEYEAFQFDSAMAYLVRNLQLANRIGERSKIDVTRIRIGFLYTTSGLYLEASQTLNREIDTARLDPALWTDYYCAQLRFCRDFREYTQLHNATDSLTRKVAYYRSRLFGTLDPESDLFRTLKIQECLDLKDFTSADALNARMLSRYTSDSREYAMRAYDQAIICEALGNDNARMEWYIRSAMADVMSSTKDNASLCCLARLLFDQQEVQRAFRYIYISMDDALFYNAKLRPWQVAVTLPVIERAYQERINTQQRQLHVFFIVTSLLALVLAFILIYVGVQYRRLRRVKLELERKNAEINRYNLELSRINLRLKELNGALAESDGVKEEYIALFLSMCSDYIEKLQNYQRNVRRKLSAGKTAELQQEVSSSELMDRELREFYSLFDTVFLRLYPNFVEAFNSQLEDNERIEPAKGELLNTELRIFALIRLGINDSSKIAALLRYSVNTIYNYRAKIKNKARCSRDDFEERIKTIGSFKS